MTKYVLSGPGGTLAGHILYLRVFPAATGRVVARILRNEPGGQQCDGRLVLPRIRYIYRVRRQ